MMLPKPISAVYNTKDSVYVLGFSTDLHYALVVFRDYKDGHPKGPGQVQTVLAVELILMMNEVEALAS